jgi:hypothetical protein
MLGDGRVEHVEEGRCKRVALTSSSAYVDGYCVHAAIITDSSQVGVQAPEQSDCVFRDANASKRRPQCRMSDTVKCFGEVKHGSIKRLVPKGLLLD